MMSKERPDWCDDKECSPLIRMDCVGGIQCIGKLKKAKPHISNNLNTMAWCHGNSEDKFYVNRYDFIVFVYMIGIALRSQDLALPAPIVNYLPKELIENG